MSKTQRVVLIDALHHTHDGVDLSFAAGPHTLPAHLVEAARAKGLVADDKAVAPVAEPNAVREPVKPRPAPKAKAPAKPKAKA